MKIYLLNIIYLEMALRFFLSKIRSRNPGKRPRAKSQDNEDNRSGFCLRLRTVFKRNQIDSIISMKVSSDWIK